MTTQNSSISRREALLHGLTGAAALTGGAMLLQGSREAEGQAPKRPNIIIFHTDDQDFNTVGCYGYDVLTPHIDGLAGNGVRFNRGYVCTGVCMASRYGLITGQFPSRCPHPNFQRAYPKNVMTEPFFNTHLSVGQHNIASVMKSAGYKTGVVGKWGIGGVDRSALNKLERSSFWARAWRTMADDVNPRDPKVSDILAESHEQQVKDIKRFGFDYAAGITDNPEAWQSRSLNYHNPEWVTSAALDFIDQSKSDPFFLYINQTLHHIPHPQESIFNGDPRMTHEGYLDKIPDCMPPREEIVAKVKDAGYSEHTAYCTWLDEALGAVMRKLGEHAITDDTLVLFISDNNVPAKATIYEGGVRVPLIASYPRMVPGGRITESLAQNLDLAPTAFAAAGITPPSDMHIDGVNLMPFLTEERQSTQDALFFEIGWTRAVCTDRWKYLALRFSERAEKRRLAKGGQFPWVYHTGSLEPHQHHVMLWRPGFFESDQLYDMHADSDEIVNLSFKQQHSRILGDMKERLGTWLRTFDHPYAEFTG